MGRSGGKDTAHVRMRVFRARKALAQRIEARGLYIHPDDEERVKAFVRAVNREREKQESGK
jgi:hypothetical protein